MAKHVRSGIHLPGAEVDMRRVRQELKGRSGSDILSNQIKRGLSQKTIDEKFETILTRMKRENRRVNKLRRQICMPDSQAAKDREHKLMIKTSLLNKLQIALLVLSEEKNKQENRAANRKEIRQALENSEVVRIGKNNTKLVGRTGDAVLMDQRNRPLALPKMTQRKENALIKTEMAETIKKHREAEKNKFKKFAPEIQSEIERVFGATKEEIPSQDDFEKMFEDD